MGSLARAAGVVLLAAACAAQACDVPGDGTSLRRALLKVKYLPETEAWERAASATAIVHYVLTLDAPVEREGLCFWPIEVRSGEELWNTFYATPGGEHLRVAGPGGQWLTLDDWRRSTR